MFVLKTNTNSLCSHIECRKEARWEKEYARARRNEIFSVQVPRHYEGKSFKHLVKVLLCLLILAPLGLLHQVPRHCVWCSCAHR